MLGAALLGALGGCVLHEPEPDCEQINPGAGHLVIYIGRSKAPQDDRVLREDGSEEVLWSRQAPASAATALAFFVKDIDPETLDEGDFVEVRPVKGERSETEHVVLERPREKDASFRLIQVQLYRHGDRWIPERIVVCHGDPGRQSRRDY